jgi:factor associated with neutral sphingomyelinase activation
MLRLQNGKFDEPDRLFHNIEETWNNVLINSADLKELIPEFFVDGGFLNNEEGLYFGVRQDRSRINNVVLPAWASSADDFIRKHREALESEHVSLNINQWIDLIFGYKQRGEEALRADNCTRKATFEDPICCILIASPVYSVPPLDI